MRARFPVGFVLLLGLFLACGGRSIPGDGDSSWGGEQTGTSGRNQGATNQGGTKTGAGGRGSTGGSVSQGGVSQGGVATAGTTAAGGGCTCANIGCPAGSRVVPNADGCCFHCEPTCPPCPATACAPGSHSEMVPGQCCPICVVSDCQTQQANYRQVRDQFIDKYSTVSCSTSADCTMFFEKNACAVGCGVPLATSIVASFDANLQNIAARYCTPECAPLIPPCEPPSDPICIDNLCR